MNFTIENGKVTGEFEFGSLSISSNEELGFRPIQLFISSLAGCSGTLLGNILRKKRIEWSKIEIDTDVVRNPDQANRIEHIGFKANVFSDKQLTEEQSAKLSALVIQHCGMIQSVINSIHINFEIAFVV
ncbi:OsmC family protein [Heyndrickxia sp. NPDC080065]|uniref:OsmC family protein n=1 Tax=Heyndrickxia sp. NPDC080065 TaxID=3390568 RepID=UPI003D037179